jgi:MoaA/NifB/PqqE/SkfB family radical SAM enzyme
MKHIPIINNSIKLFSKKNLSGKICLSPYVSIEVNLTGDVRLCGCLSWMPTTVGNLFENTIDEILSSPLSQSIRNSIASGTYEYCNEHDCGVMHKPGGLSSVDFLPPAVVELVNDSSMYLMPNEISLAIDATCNLSCPSCRTAVIKNSAETVERLVELGNRLRTNLFTTPTDQHIRLHTSTSGELFASPLLLSFVNSIPVDDFPNLALCIQTNGLMAERNWHKLGPMQSHVKKITVTSDAARPATYEKLRRGGRWPDIQQALKWISEKKKENGMQLHMRMVVQHSNYQEIPEFYEQAMLLGADEIEYARLFNWATYSTEEFQHHDVFNPAHPEFDQAQIILNQVKHLPKVFFYGGLS